MDAATELEEEQRLRTKEIYFLQNVCSGLRTDEDKDQMRRAMVVMLYSHFEGFAKFGFEVYRRAVESSNAKCTEVQSALACGALRDLFKAIRNPDQGSALLPVALNRIYELKPMAIERAFVEKAWDFGQRTVSVPEGFIDMESNLTPTVLRKNLYRLGLPHALFDQLGTSINKLLQFRNDIAHGARVGGITEVDYTQLQVAVFRMMDELKATLVSSIEKKAFLLAPNTSDCFCI
jgi:hypothetical protein